MEITPVPVVYIVDDDEPVRDGLSRLLRSIGLHTEVFATSDEFLAFQRPNRPSCLVLDVRMPGKSGLVLQQEFAQLGLRMPIVFITGYGNIEMSVKAMKAGAIDFLAKPFHDQDMLDAVTAALARDSKRLAAEQSLAPLRDAYTRLSERERQVLGHILSGLLNKQIACKMNLSEVTIKIHRRKILMKMGARSIAELALMATSIGIGPTR